MRKIFVFVLQEEHHPPFSSGQYWRKREYVDNNILGKHPEKINKQLRPTNKSLLDYKQAALHYGPRQAVTLPPNYPPVFWPYLCDRVTMSAFHCNKTEECHNLLSALTRVATHLLFSNGHRHLTNGACLFRQLHILGSHLQLIFLLVFPLWTVNPIT